ncbi:hypothetical protein T492DRAFT_880153 [Pavlovales sp. CCMP2436]|nr:hypothetical protein T492DRAFT_880153 [Pavlovales sp. CCMP2436]
MPAWLENFRTVFFDDTTKRLRPMQHGAALGLLWVVHTAAGRRGARDGSKRSIELVRAHLPHHVQTTWDFALAEGALIAPWRAKKARNVSRAVTASFASVPLSLDLMSGC